MVGVQAVSVNIAAKIKKCG
jgi:hypothetical protein